MLQRKLNTLSSFDQIVVVSSYNAQKALLDKEDVSGRMWNGFLVDRSHGKELGKLLNKFIFI